MFKQVNFILILTCFSFKESQHQRIIYSGQLLNDNLILKDVFREVSSLNLHCIESRDSNEVVKPTVDILVPSFGLSLS